MTRYFADQYIVPFFKDRRDPLIDRIYTHLCVAKRLADGRPIYNDIWMIDDPDDKISRVVDPTELCQCCETKLAQLNNGGMIYRNNMGYKLIDQNGEPIRTKPEGYF